MSAATLGAGVVTPSMVSGRARFVKSRPVNQPGRYGEKPCVKVVEGAFAGPVLRLSARLRLLEEADQRGIRRGDALDAINNIQRARQKQFKLMPRTATQIFARHFAGFAAAYIVLAIAWCGVMAL